MRRERAPIAVNRLDCAAQTMSKYLSVEYQLISNKTSTLASAVQKIDFLGPHFGGFPGELPQKISGEKIAFATQQLYTKIRFRCAVD